MPTEGLGAALASISPETTKDLAPPAPAVEGPGDEVMERDPAESVAGEDMMAAVRAGDVEGFLDALDDYMRIKGR